MLKLIYKANQWTGFYMIRTSGMIKLTHDIPKMFSHFNFTTFARLEQCHEMELIIINIIIPVFPFSHINGNKWFGSNLDILHSVLYPFLI